MGGKIDIDTAPQVHGTLYPDPFAEICAQRRRKKLGDAAGLTQFGVNLQRLPPGQWSSQRHWHSQEDEFVWVVEGEVVLVTDAGEQVLRAGDCAGFKCGDPDGHHLQNRSEADALILEIGSRFPQTDATTYSDIDLAFPAGAPGYTHADGAPYPGMRRRAD